MEITAKISTTARCLALFLSLVLFAIVNSSTTQAATATKSKNSSQDATPREKPPVVGPADDYDRGVPRSSVKGFFRATRDGDYETAARYLDLRYIPKGMSQEGPELARQLKFVLDRTMWIDLDTLSDHPKGHRQDGLPSYRDSLGRLKTPQRTVDIFLQLVPRKDGVFIWKISNHTVAQIPHLYRHFGYRPLEERLSRLLPYLPSEKGIIRQ